MTEATSTTPATKSIGEQLREPFPLKSLGFKPQVVKNNRALAVAYIDARDVMQRLDDVLGTENWSDEYTPLPDGSVMCRLSVRFGDRWVTKCDVGSPSEQPDSGDRTKAAVSDALKRAAVKFGVGRYLYAIPAVWADYDPVKKEFVGTPVVPATFLPTPVKGQPAPAKQALSPEADGRNRLNAAKTEAALKGVWDSLPPDLRTILEAEKNKCKAQLEKATPQRPFDHTKRMTMTA